MIEYRDSSAALKASQLEGFFVGWSTSPTPETHLALLHGSSHVVVAIDREQDRVVGFVTATSDGVLSASIPLLEVLPVYQGQGIGTKLMNQMLAQLKGLYMVDLQCDPDLQPFYERLNMDKAVGMRIRSRNA